MWLLLPVGAFSFVIFALASLHDIRKEKNWLVPGFVAAISLAAMTFGWMEIVARL